MNLQKDIKVNNGLWIKSIDFKWLLYVATLSVPMTHATPPSEQYHTLKNNLTKLFVPQSSDEFKVAQMQKLSNFSVDSSLGSDLPVVGSGRPQETIPTAFWQNQSKVLKDAVQIAVQRNPEIAQGISALASQNANIDVAKSGYYPQVGGGVSTGDLGKKSTRGQQLLTLSATQMLYDFGKVKSGGTIFFFEF